MDFELDSDGYPTEEDLECIAAWSHADGFRALLVAIEPIWAHAKAGYFRQEGQQFYLSTAGWSGNESIIAALQRNFVFWSLCWVSSRRGGHYVFEVLR